MIIFTNARNQMLKRILLIGIEFLFIHLADGWIYGPFGDDDWGRSHPTCDKDRQSPVSIKRTETIFNPNLHPLQIYVSYDPRVTGLSTKIIAGNNGHSIFISFGDIKMYLSGSNLPRAFKVLNAHIHWGENSEEGSEHVIDGKRFPLEMHIVTFDIEKYATIADALNGTDSLAVYGIFFELSTNDNPYLEPIASNAKNMRYTGESVTLSNLDLLKFLPDTYDTKYYRYPGSLTTPPCSESVIWTIADKHNYVSERQLDEFRKIFDFYNHTQTRNWRRTHPLGERKVERSFQWGSSIAGVLRANVSGLLMSFFIALKFFYHV